MNESSKARARREREGLLKYFQEPGIDIGGGADSWPGFRRWDIEDGDAQVMEGVPAESYRTVYSSHCLEHMVDADAALKRWWELVQPGGCLIVQVPDEDLYEQGMWPSVWNPDHKWTFSLWKPSSWSPVHKDLMPMIAALPRAELLYARQVDTNYDYSLRTFEQIRQGIRHLNATDQTLHNAEAAIEIIVKKQD